MGGWAGGGASTQPAAAGPAQTPSRNPGTPPDPALTLQRRQWALRVPGPHLPLRRGQRAPGRPAQAALLQVCCGLQGLDWEPPLGGAGVPAWPVCLAYSPAGGKRPWWGLGGASEAIAAAAALVHSVTSLPAYLPLYVLPCEVAASRLASPLSTPARPPSHPCTPWCPPPPLSISTPHPPTATNGTVRFRATLRRRPSTMTAAQRSRST